MLYSQHASTIFSIEFLGRTPDKERLRGVLGDNGAVGNSPSATAYYLTFFPDAAPAWEYLDIVYHSYQYAPFVYPFRTFDLVWVLNSLRYTGQPLTEFADPEHWETLQTALTSEGISFDPTFLVMDGDSTSATVRVLLEAGYAVDPHVLATFQSPRHYCFALTPLSEISVFLPMSMHWRHCIICHSSRTVMRHVTRCSLPCCDNSPMICTGLMIGMLHPIT